NTCTAIGTNIIVFNSNGISVTNNTGATAQVNIYGSPQEFVGSGILRGFPGFLKGDVFGVGHYHALRLQEQVAHVLIAAPAVNKHADVAVDSLDDSEANFGAAVVQNPIEVFEQHLGKLLKRGQTLPPQLVHPLPEIVEHGPLIAVVPESFQALLQQVGFEDPPVDLEEPVQH